jgi:hypothetical protein
VTLADDLSHLEAAEYWRKIFWYVGIPIGILVGINTYYLEKEHHEHLQEHPHEPPNYPHLHIRSKVSMKIIIISDI